MKTLHPNQVIRVALPVPLPQLFDYLPADSDSRMGVGSRVLVPFGKRQLVGIVVEKVASSDVPMDRLLAVTRVLDEGDVLLDSSLMKLMKWCWQYYKHAPGEVLQTALPPALRKADTDLPPAPLQYGLTAAGRERLGQAPGRAHAQHAMLGLMKEQAIAAAGLSESGIRWRQNLKRLQEQDWVFSELASPELAQISPGPLLTDEQQLAVKEMGSGRSGFQCHLLDGVTGSGKTEVYLHLLEDVLQQGQQGLVLVPEIGLTPQLLRRFRKRLGLDPAVIHSRISQGERLVAWQAARTARSRLVIGTRSALFTPMPELGLIVLDEEHDASFKQQDGFRYSARDVAVKRAADLDIPIVLGSATPSLESLNNTESGRYTRQRLRHRATDAALPSWRILDMSQSVGEHGIAKAAYEAMTETLDRQEQVMVFLNRRGWAPVLMCEQCGWHGTCDRCDANLTWHRSIGALWCHHCGSQRRVPPVCPDCRADALVSAGEGTQQLERNIQTHFPETRVLRFDRDSTSRKGSFDDQVDEVMQGKPCVLVGTQMLAKGHHFPNVTLVVVVNMDQALYSPDFRALERLGQTLLQVSGRAGRVEKPGTVILQTFHPDSEALELLINHGYEKFSDWLLADRRLAGLPPITFQALLRSDAHDSSDVDRFLRDASACFPAGASQLFGPMPALLERVAGRYRKYLMVQGNQRVELHRQIDCWLAVLRKLPTARKVRWAIDMDPQDL